MLDIHKIISPDSQKAFPRSWPNVNLFANLRLPIALT